MTNILITGIAGFVGSHLASYLSRQLENKIYGIFRSIRHDSTFNALGLKENKNIDMIQGNVRSYTDIKEIMIKHDIDIVYHLAAKTIVKECSKLPIVTFGTNAFGTANVLDAVKSTSTSLDKEIPILVTSSDKAYGTSPKLPYKEDFPLNGLDIYSSSKACEDIIARAYAHNYNMPIIVTRSCNVFGEYDFNWSRIVPSLAKACLSGNDQPLVLNKGSYHYKREYIYIKDLIIILESLMKSIDDTRGEIFNISSGNIFTTEELVHKFLNLCGQTNKKIIFKEKESTFKEIDDQYLDGTKLSNIIGSKLANHCIEDSLTLTINGYKKWFNQI